MRLILDAQLPPALGAWVAGACGCECVHVSEVGLLHSDDAEIFTALRASGAVILSKDQDFVDLVTRLGPPPQVMWLRCGNCSNEVLLGFLARVLPAAMELMRGGESCVELRRVAS